MELFFLITGLLWFANAAQGFTSWVRLRSVHPNVKADDIFVIAFAQSVFAGVCFTLAWMEV